MTFSLSVEREGLIRIVLGEVEVGNCQFLHRSKKERNASIWRAIRRKGENASFFLLPELSGFAVYDCGEGVRVSCLFRSPDISQLSLKFAFFRMTMQPKKCAYEI